MFICVFPDSADVHHHDDRQPRGPDTHAWPERENTVCWVFRTSGQHAILQLLQPALDSCVHLLRFQNAQATGQLQGDKVHHDLHLQHSAPVVCVLTRLFHVWVLHVGATVSAGNIALLCLVFAGLFFPAQAVRCLLLIQGEHASPRIRPRQCYSSVVTDFLSLSLS